MAMDGWMDRSIDLTGCRLLHGSIALGGVVIKLWVGATTPPTHRTNGFSTSLRAISDEADTASARQRIHGLIESTARFIESILCAIAPSADRWVGRGWVGLNVVGAGSVDFNARRFRRMILHVSPSTGPKLEMASIEEVANPGALAQILGMRTWLGRPRLSFDGWLICRRHHIN